MARYRCTVCNWVYDEEVEGVPFADVPETWTCPQCGAPKSAFVPEAREVAPEDVETTVADKLVEQLVALGVREIYGIPGDSNLPLVDAVRRDGRIRFVLTRHEQTAAFMASARGKITGEIGVCMSIAGPGSTNLVTGLMDAASDRSPVLALVGQVPEVYLGSEAFQEIDQLELFHPFSLFSETLARASQATKFALSAVKHAHRGPGVSVLSTPADVLAETPARAHDPEAVVDAILEGLADARQVFEQGTMEERKRVVRAFVEGIRLDAASGVAEITMKKLPEPDLPGTGSSFVLVAGARFAPDSEQLSTITAHWRYQGAKHAEREMVRAGTGV
jgi:rubredoxin